MRRSTTPRATSKAAPLDFRWAVERNKLEVALATLVRRFWSPASAWCCVKQQFFPAVGPARGARRGPDAQGHRDRADRARRRRKSRHGCASSPKAKIVTAYVGQGAPRFYHVAVARASRSVLRQDRGAAPRSEEARDALKAAPAGRSSARACAGGAGARRRSSCSAPYSPFPVAFRVQRARCDAARAVSPRRCARIMLAGPDDADGQHRLGRARARRCTSMLDQDRLRALGLTSSRRRRAAAVPAHGRRRCRRSARISACVEVVARSAGADAARSGARRPISR